MPSQALVNLQMALEEVQALQSANPSPTGALPSHPAVTRAIGRASIVLLSSHLERYVYAINEEAVDHLNISGVLPHKLPLIVRLLHSREVVDKLSEAQWDKRDKHLAEFVRTDAWLWSNGVSGNLDHKRLLVWMKTPDPKRLIRYFKCWDIEDIFCEITRKPTTREHLYLKLGELVAKRNNIAHGDTTVEATQRDVKSYLNAVKIFCDRADRQVARRISTISGASKPW